jgi:superoxide dismutase, Cu-Zn family
MSLQCWRGVTTGRLVALAIAAAAAPSVCHAAVGDKAFADVKLRDGRDAGRIEIIETVAGVLLKVKLKGLPVGRLGFHVHEVGRCLPDFKAAGGIFNPLGAKHGYLNDEGPMVGDLPNLVVPAGGEVEVELVSPFLNLSKDSEDSIFGQNGSSILIFERPDDHRSQPAGNSGEAIACGVIVAGK